LHSSTIAVIGAGAGGSALAVGLTLKGHRVRLCGRSFAKRSRLRAKKEVEYRGELGEGTVSLSSATTDMNEAVKGASLILIVVPAFAQFDVSNLLLRTRLSRDQVVVFAPGACASLECRALLNKVDVIGELLTIPYGARLSNEIIDITAPTSARGSSLRVSSFPGSRIESVLDSLEDVVVTKRGTDVVEIGILNPSWIVHPAAMLFNLSPHERNDAGFSTLAEGLTDSVSRLISKLDLEKAAICRSLGLSPLTVSEVYREFAPEMPPLLKRSPNVRRLSRGESRPYSVQSRFVTEDVPYGLGLISSIGVVANTETPLVDSVIRVFSAALDEDFLSKGRTLARMGLESVSRLELPRLLYEGPIPSR